MAKNRIIFTDNKQSKRGIMSVVLATICFLSMIYSIVVSYRLEGEVSQSIGTGLVMTLIMSVTGMVLGVSARLDGNKFKLLPVLGIVINGIVIVSLAFLLGLGLRE